MLAPTRSQQVDREILVSDTMSVILLVFVSIFSSRPFIFHLSFFSISSSSSFNNNGMICELFYISKEEEIRTTERMKHTK
jgi:hypothetical protein